MLSSATALTLIHGWENKFLLFYRCDNDVSHMSDSLSLTLSVWWVLIWGHIKRLKWNRWCFKFIPPTGQFLWHQSVSNWAIKTFTEKCHHRIRHPHSCVVQRIIFITLFMSHHKKSSLLLKTEEKQSFYRKNNLQRNLGNQKMSYELSTYLQNNII